MIEASCHCGAVRLPLPERPQRLTSCNCSLCRRYGALWSYWRPDQVTFVSGGGTTVPYIQGERTLAMRPARPVVASRTMRASARGSGRWSTPA